MFRELTRKKQELTKEECISILKEEKRGVLSVNGDGGFPYGAPMNHWYNEEDGKIYFHCGRGGHRLDALQKDGKVSFCVTDGGFCNEGEWALNVRSVVVFGTVEIVEDMGKIIEITEKLSYKFTNDGEYIKNEVQNHAHRTLLLCLTPLHICGKIVKEA